MKINETGMNELILRLPLAVVLAHAGPADVAERPSGATPRNTPVQSDQAPSLGPARTTLWVALGICVALVVWALFQSEQQATPPPLSEPKIAVPPAQNKMEQAMVPTLEPWPPMTNDLTELPVVVAMTTPAPAHAPAAEKQKQVEPIQKKTSTSAHQSTKANSSADPIATAHRASGPVAEITNEMPRSASTPMATAEKIDGAAMGVISTAHDKLVMSVDGSFRAFRPGDRLPFNEVLVSVRDGTITTDRRVIELTQP